MPHSILSISLAALLISATTPAPQFDLRDVPEPNAQKVADPAPNALDAFLFEGFYKNPVGNYVRSDEWEEDFPVTIDDGRLKVAASLVTAARNEDDARALSAVLAAYRDGADKVLPPAEPSAVTFGGSNTAGGDADSAARNRFETGHRGKKSGNSNPADSAKQNSNMVNDRLGARIVANLATFRSCSGALVAYLNHLSDDDAKAASWARMIRRSLGMAALPPDHSCIKDFG